MMRNTIVLTMAMGTALASCAGDGGFAIRNVVPMYIGHESEQAARCVEMEARTGEGVALYSLTLHPEGVPATEKSTSSATTLHVPLRRRDRPR